MRARSVARAILPLAAIAALYPGAALAHGEGVTGGFASGFTHPSLGWDHVVAMVAVGLWGAFLGRPALWRLPVIFPLVMAFGAALGIFGFPLPAIETGIAGSAVVFGLLILLALRLPLWAATAIVGGFAIFHGYAHGAELPELADPFAFAAGFVIATGILHLTGIAFGLMLRWPAGRIAVRAGGGAIAGVGLAFLFGIV
jgi:urease accessory protein